MAKTYIDIVKYMVYANFEIHGLVDKPDVVGAIFGQTEGLIGEELDLRELQKSGRIGRIEVELETKHGKTTGRLIIPSSLDMVETCILASSLETVERVGPCEAKMKVEKIEDTRNAKRKYIVERAKQLLRSVLNEEIPESKVISEMVREQVKTSEITEYGPEKLPAGPNIDKHDSIIIVEGRADVINLLKNDITNVVAIGGARVNDTIIRLTKEKEVTVFIDGDRGGEMILRALSDVGEIDFVARAPTGKEVEDLSRKELIKCLRNKIPFEQFAAKRPIKPPNGQLIVQEEDTNKQQTSQESKTPIQTQTQDTQKEKVDIQSYVKELEELENTLRARIYLNKGDKPIEIPVRDIIKKLEEIKTGYAIVFDGVITQRLLEIAEEKSFKVIVGIRKGHIYKDYPNITIFVKYE
ncbi:MAG: DNA primase DnaG [Candidatus Micrarchaeota archaeon]|nr:DNA primase DnaG [Candidatus Micrarchaeota archaeon]